MSSKSMKFQYIDPALLKPNPWNPNHVSPANEDKLRESVGRGWFKPIIVRTLDDGSMEILGGQHRWGIARRSGQEVPVIDLGKISDQRAKEIVLLDNGRYGEDDPLQLAEILESIGSVEDIAAFMPFAESDLSSIFSAARIDLDEIGLDESDEELPALPAASAPVQQYQIMRFKVPVEDAADVERAITGIIKRQGLSDPDSLLVAGQALISLCRGDAE